jgi:hypothetical protein
MLDVIFDVPLLLSLTIAIITKLVFESRAFVLFYGIGNIVDNSFFSLNSLKKLIFFA